MSFLSEIRSSRNARISLAIIVTVAVYYGFLSYIVPWSHDDMAYQFNFASEAAGDKYDRINSVAEIFESQADHYMRVNGRFVAHFFVQLFCGLLGHGFFAVFNALFYIIFTLLILRLSGQELKRTATTITALILVVLSFQTKLTPSCQIGYIWMYSIIMAFIWLFFLCSQWKSRVVTVILGLFSLIAGNAHESFAIGVLAALIAYWLKKRKRMNASQYVMLICFGIGALSCCLSPGILHRASESPLPSSLLGFGKMMMTFAKFSSALFILAAITGWQLLIKKKTWREIYRVGPFYWNVLIVLLIFNFCISIHINRQLFGVELMAVILSIKLLKKHSFTCTWLWLLGALACVCMTAITDFAWRYSGYFDEIVQQYQTSPTGEVFVDLNEEFILNQQRVPVSPFCYYNILPDVNGPDNSEMYYEDLCMERFFKTSYPGHPSIRILPVVLRGNRHRQLSNQVFEYGRELVVVIQDKSRPSDIILKSGVHIPGIDIEMPDEIITNTNRTAVDADHWRAYIYELAPFAKYGRITQRTVEIVPRRD